MSTSILREMHQAARRAPRVLRDGADPIADFLLENINPDGGAKNRSGDSDLYYTVFVLQGLKALSVEPPEDRVDSHLLSYGDGDALDLVHLACLARCRALMKHHPIEPATATAILKRMEACRCADGGYGAHSSAESGTIYHGFMALSTYQDLNAELPNPAGLLACIDGLATPDGGYANEHALPIGTTPAAAAAALVIKHLDRPSPELLTGWLLDRLHPEGGFLAMPQAPAPDLLSTATALHALGVSGVTLDEIREPCLDFLDMLWSGRAFCGAASDRMEDSEYTYYALLALGHLSEQS